MTEPLADVQMTAVGVAYARAIESRRDDALFHDELAQSFVDAARFSEWRAGQQLDDDAATRYRAGVGLWVAIRTRFLDEIVLDAAREGTRQLVILGAGLDCRAFRLAWPNGMRCFEIDVPDMVEFKNGVLASTGAEPGCTRTPIPCDLRDDWAGALRAAGFDASARSVWIAEGLLAYLPPEANDLLIHSMATLAASGSRAGITLARRSNEREVNARIRGLWQSTGPDDPLAWFAGFGWDASLYSVTERAVAYGRPLPDEVPLSTARLVDARRD
jgi:methyltransferase (TIGR00027 family)